MGLTPPTSIFRCMPSILPIAFRRLLGGFSYAIDGVELSYQRLRETALMYELPASNADRAPANSIGRNRLALVVDAWSLIDHVSRARKLVSRIPWTSGSPGADLNSFIRETKAAALIRNKLHEIEENVGEGAADLDGQSIVGTVDWIDTRTAGGVIRYAVSTGPGADDESILTAIPAADIRGDVTEFRLTVAGHQADLDRLRDAIRRFAGILEASITRSVRDAVVAEAKKRETPVVQLCASSLADVTSALRFERESLDGRRLSPELRRTWVEVSADAFVIVE